MTAPRHVDAPPPFQPGKPVGNIYYGACSWTDRTLIDAGTFYSATARTAADRLAYYADADASVGPLVGAGKLGCVLFQFPHWFTARRAHNRYLEQLRNRSDWPLAVEFRGGGWMTDNYRARTLALLEKLGIAYVVVNEPQGFRSSTPPVVAATSPLALVRFHGHNAENYDKPNISAAERFRYLYSRDELGEWVPRIRQAATEARETHVLMNNCYANYGTTNAREIARLLEDLRRRPNGGDAVQQLLFRRLVRTHALSSCDLCSLPTRLTTYLGCATWAW